MPQNGYSIGRDKTITVVLPSGSPLNLGTITKFTSKQTSKDQPITGINGVTEHLRFFQGWSGSFDCERRNDELDSYFAELEANYYAGIEEQSAVIQETITEPNGSVSQFLYVNVMLKYDDAGDVSGDASIKQKVSFQAARRIKVG